MKRTLASVAGMVGLVVVDVLATCGGGGGGGTGGMGGGGGMSEVVYQVPWKLLTGDATARRRRPGRLLVPRVGERAQELEPAQLAHARRSTRRSA